MALQNYTHAIKCYQEQLERAQELQDSAFEAEAFGNLGIAKLNRYDNSNNINRNICCVNNDIFDISRNKIGCQSKPLIFHNDHTT